MRPAELTDDERAAYEWQMGLEGFGEDGQRKLKGATALVSRCGGLGGPVCYHLASAGIGRLIVAHGGALKPGDLNRQILMSHADIGRPRIDSLARRLRAYNPRLDLVAVGENIGEENAARLVGQADIVFDCAPLFRERFLLNRECVRQGRPMIEAAMFGMEGQVLTILPGRTACLACLYPEDPPRWRRQFPVLGAVSALAGAAAAIEGIKVLVGLPPALAGVLLYYDSRTMSFQKIPLARRPGCAVCGAAGLKAP